MNGRMGGRGFGNLYLFSLFLMHFRMSIVKDFLVYLICIKF